MSIDRIEKRLDLRAPRSRVWRAIANAEEFGAWFGVRIDGAFTPGTSVQGRITSPGYEHLTQEMTMLTVVESGFDGIPLARRAEAFRMNDQGWQIQIRNIERHVAA
jgi:hypothetical protein